MRYFVTIDERTFEVEFAGDGVRVDGRTLAVELVRVGDTPVHRLSIDGESHRLIADRTAQRGVWDLHLDGFRIAAEVVDERTRAIRALTTQPTVATGPKAVRAPMPGMVVRVEVTPGEKVRAGQGIVIIEAMKMENELRADAEGIVSRIAVTAGMAVEKGAILVEFAGDD